MKRPFGKSLIWVLVLTFVSIYAAMMSTPTFANEPVPEMKYIKVGLLSPSATMAPLWAARDGGYFAKYGLDVEINMMGTAAKTTAALLSGDIQFGVGGVGQTLNVVAGGGDMVAISGLMSRSAFRWFGAPGIETIEDLRGKKIGLPSLGSAADVELRAILAYHGMMVPKDAQIVGVGGLPEIYAALVNGSIQAGILVAPLSFMAVDDGLALLATPAQLQDWDILGDDRIVSTRAWLAKNPVTAELFLKGYLEGLYRTVTDKEFAIWIISQNTGVDQATAERTYEDLVDGFTELRAYITQEQAARIKELVMLTTDNPKLASTPSSAAIDMSFLEKLDQSGFIDSIIDNQ